MNKKVDKEVSKDFMRMIVEAVNSCAYLGGRKGVEWEQGVAFGRVAGLCSAAFSIFDENSAEFKFAECSYEHACTIGAPRNYHDSFADLGFERALKVVSARFGL